MKFKTEKEILLEMIAKAQEQKLISEADDIIERVGNDELTENQYVLDLATHAYILSDFMNRLEEIYTGVDIATARGGQLDRLGNLVNVERLRGLPAVIELQLSLPVSQSGDIIIPAGTEVVIDQLQVDPYITYRTDEQVTITAGTTSASVTCSSDYHSLQRRVPEGCVQGLVGFPTVIVTNHYGGTQGRTIEDDDNYRQRILLWNVKNQIGTKAAFDAYLGSYVGLDDYKLVAQPEGVGTLTVVCDCTEDALIPLQQGIQENCMLYTDDPVDCVGYTPIHLDIAVTATVTREPIQHTVSELIELIQREVEVFIDGGNQRTGGTTHGLHIGEELAQSQLMMHLHQMFPELTEITAITVTPVPEEGQEEAEELSDYHKYQSRVVTVVIE